MMFVKLLVLAFLVSLAMAVTSASAAKPLRCDLAVTPSVVTAGQPYTISGAGCPPDTRIHLSAATPGCCSANSVTSDGAGEFEAGFTAGIAGEYRFTALSQVAKGKSGKTRFVVHDVLTFLVN